MKFLLVQAALMLAAMSGPVNAVAVDATESVECVILLHGLARSAASMNEMEEKLTAAGYLVVNYDYPSRQHTVEYLARVHLPDAMELCGAAPRINFVAHSMGGILVRFYLSENELERLGRVVLLGPPNQGSEVVDKLEGVPGFYLLNGPAGKQLGTDPEDIPARLPPADFEVGIIAGSRTINFILSLLIPGDDDGKVSIESTKLEGMSDFLLVAHTHPLMMKSDDVIEQVIFFLRNGRFDHS